MKLLLERSDYNGVKKLHGWAVKNGVEDTPLMNQVGDMLGANPIDSVAARNDGKVGRNSKCPCGSGKKFKHCCGKA